MLRMAAWPPDPVALAGWFADHARERATGEAFRFAILAEGRMIGLVDVDEIAAGEGDLGYWLEKGAWGRGYAFEAAQALVRFAFLEIGLARLRSGHAADNPASGAVLKKLGFRWIGSASVPSRPGGGEIDQERYCLESRSPGRPGPEHARREDAVRRPGRRRPRSQLLQ